MSMALAILGIIYEMMKGFVLLLPNLLKLVDLIVNYFVDKNKRIKDAEIALQNALKQSADRALDRAFANIIASRSIRDAGWNYDLDVILELLKSDKSYREQLLFLYNKMPYCDWNEVTKVVDSEKPPEEKAFLLVEMIRIAGEQTKGIVDGK